MDAQAKKIAARWAQGPLVTQHRIRTAYAEETPDLVAYLDSKLQVFPKRGNQEAWWAPPHNLALVLENHEWELYRFTILLPKAELTGYNDEENGIVIKPYWTRAVWGMKLTELSMKTVDLFINGMKTYASVRDTVLDELDWLGNMARIEIPSKIRSNVSKEALHAAQTVMGHDYHSIQARLIPLDGSKSHPVHTYV